MMIANEVQSVCLSDFFHALAQRLSLSRITIFIRLPIMDVLLLVAVSH